MQKHTSYQVGWKYIVTALALSVAMAPMAQAASVLKSTGKLEITGTPTSRTARTTSMAKAAVLVASKTKELAGQKYTFQKWLDAKGNTLSVILDEKGNAVSESALPKIAQVILQPELEELLRTRSGRRGLHKVNVALDFCGFVCPDDRNHQRPQTGTVQIGELTGDLQLKSKHHEFKGRINEAISLPTAPTADIILQVNGRTVSEEEYARLQVFDQKSNQAQAVERFAERNAFVEAFAKRHNIELAKDALESSGRVLTFELTAEQIEDLAHSGDSSVRGIELHREPTLMSAGATNMTHSAVDPWAHDYALTRGNGVGVFWAEYGCPDEDDIDGSYTRLSGTPHWHSQIVGDVLRDVSPESKLYCRGPADADGTPTQSDLTTLDPPIDVVSHSTGYPGQTTYKADDREYDDFVYDNLIPWFNSAGNYGGAGEDGLTVGRAQGLNVIAVGNYLHANQSAEGESSWVDPSTGNDKPEVVAPATSTSRAAPHGAAFSANSMSQSTFQRNKPHLVKAKQIAGATDEIAGGYDKVGAGGIDFKSSHYDGWNYWMHGANDDFSTLDSGDGSRDGYITREVYIPNTYEAVRLAMTWLTRGSYTYDHKDDAHAIGMDLDVLILDPSGQYVGGSWSYDNAFEFVDFEPTISGTYTFKINRWSNNDTDNKFRLGVAVNFYNE